MSRKTQDSKNFNVGDVVLYEGYSCIVKNIEGQKCLGIAMPMGWYHFIPEDWSNAEKV
jgi:hypothetical protein